MVTHGPFLHAEQRRAPVETVLQDKMAASEQRFGPCPLTPRDEVVSLSPTGVTVGEEVDCSGWDLTLTSFRPSSGTARNAAQCPGLITPVAREGTWADRRQAVKTVKLV